VGRDRRHDRRPLAHHLENAGGRDFVNCGWGTGGFKAIPGSGWAMAELMAKGHSPLADAFGMDRFREAASSTKAWRRGWRIDGGAADSGPCRPAGFRHRAGPGP
jgi:hypothetical protein